MNPTRLHLSISTPFNSYLICLNRWHIALLTNFVFSVFFVSSAFRQSLPVIWRELSQGSTLSSWCWMVILISSLFLKRDVLEYMNVPRNEKLIYRIILGYKRLTCLPYSFLYEQQENKNNVIISNLWRHVDLDFEEIERFETLISWWFFLDDCLLLTSIIIYL